MTFSPANGQKLGNYTFLFIKTSICTGLISTQLSGLILGAAILYYILFSNYVQWRLFSGNFLLLHKSMFCMNVFGAHWIIRQTSQQLFQQV